MFVSSKGWLAEDPNTDKEGPLRFCSLQHSVPIATVGASNKVEKKKRPEFMWRWFALEKLTHSHRWKWLYRVLKNVFVHPTNTGWGESRFTVVCVEDITVINKQ